jgi:phosphate/sulfate permease
MPVSTTHTIVASVCGFTFTAKGWKSINWPNLRIVFIGWGASPSFTFCIGWVFFTVIKYLVLRGRDPYARACIAYPLIVAFGVGIMLFLVLQKSGNRIITSSITGSSAGREWTKTVVLPSVFGTAAGCALITWFIVVPLVRKRIDRQHRERLAAEEAFRQAEEEKAMKKAEGQEVVEEEPATVEAPKRGFIVTSWIWFANNTYRQDLVTQSFNESYRAEKIWAQQPDFDPRAESLFRYVQVFTACLNAFAHGSNDVANGMGPLSAIMSIQKSGWSKSSKVEYWVLAVGGILLGVGFVFFGYRIIKAVGYKITKISPSRGACIEASAALAVSIASYLSIPVSTTQCLVGATAGVAFASGGWRAVEWCFLFLIGLSWAGIFFMATIFTGLFMWLVIQSPGLVIENNGNLTEYF